MNQGISRFATSAPGARMLLGIAAGDAFGAPYENLSYQDAAVLYQRKGLFPAPYTDDTQQALALAELLASGDPITPYSLARSFLQVYTRDPRQGYSRMTEQMLRSPDPESFLAAITPDELRNRKTDGAAMRALPIGFLPDRNEVIRYAAMSAAITHGHPDAIATTTAVALIAHERIYTITPWNRIWQSIREPIDEIHPEMIEYCDACASFPRPDRSIILREHAGYGLPYTESRLFLGAVISLLGTWGDEPCSLLKESILFGGDTDTLACVTLGASCIRGAADSLVWSLVSSLEDGPYGKEYLVSLGTRLSARFPSDS